MESEFSTFTKDDGAIITTNAPDGSLSQLVEIIEIYNTLPVEQKGNGLVLSQNFTYNESCDTGLVNGIPITGDINITSLIGVTIDGGNALTNLFVVNNSATLGLSNVKLTGVTGAVIDLKAGSALAADNCIADGYVQCANGATIVNPVVVVTYVSGGHGNYALTAEVTVGNIPVKGLIFNFVATHDGETINLGTATESDTAGIYSLESTNFGGKVGTFVVGVDLANADVTTATVDREITIWVVDNYNVTRGDIVPVVVGIDGIIDGYVDFYVDSLLLSGHVPANVFVLNATDGNYYYTFNVNSSNYNKNIVGLSARLFATGEILPVDYDDNNYIIINEPVPTISNVTVTGNYSDKVNITFTITNGKIADNIVLHLLNGTNLTQRIQNASQNTVTFTDVYLPFYSNGQITEVILVRGTNETLAIANVTWNIAKIDSTVNFNVTDITSKPGVEETVLITVLDAKGEEVKQGNITVTGTGITLIGNDDGVYDLVDGKATVTFKCAAVGEYSLNVAYTGGVATNNTDNYNPSEESLAVKIIKTNVTVTVTNTTPSGKVNDTITITGTVEDEFGTVPEGNVTITINGVPFTAVVGEDGTFTLKVNATESGKWTDTVKFISEDPTVWADAESDPVTVSVRKLHTNIVSNYTFIGDEAFNGTYGEQMTLNFTVFDENGNLVKDGQLIFWFNGIAYTTDVVDGYASITDEAFVWTSTGLFNYVVDYVNNGKVYYDSFNFTNVNIPKIATKIAINTTTVNDDNVKEGQITIKFTVTDVNGKVPVSKGVIYYVTPDGIEHSVNVENGVATVTIDVNRTGTYYIAASYYDLDGDFLYSEADFTCDVQKTTTLIKVTKEGQNLIATINVGDELGNAANGKLDLFVNGHLMALNVVNGVASVNLGAYNGPVELNAVYTGADGLRSYDNVILELDAIPENGPACEEVETGLTDVDTTEMDTEDVPGVDNETTPEVDKESAPAGGVSESSGIPMQHTAIPVLALILALSVLPLGYRRD